MNPTRYSNEKLSIQEYRAEKSLHSVCHLFPSEPYHAMGHKTLYRTSSRHTRLIPIGREISVFPISSHLVTEYWGVCTKHINFQLSPWP